ncbi:MAG: TIR domain-containing protein, partial [Firmicutes bacterium]|nr:TIR domain-containing protein [Bacillota bacterium]
LNVLPGMQVVECEYCGSTQTIPSADNEKKMLLFNRANRLRYNCEFDKAAGIYESIVAEFPEEAEAYWGLILCQYGIEYVDDPGTGKKIPTCHRSSYTSVFDDQNFELVMEYSDGEAREVYRAEAKAIDALCKRILEVSSQEEPYDIFICYKETDAKGDRTLDSVLAQDLYKELTQEGYRVFFARITLQQKLGQEYEPYIFAALNSAKVMLAVGTSYENYNAVWVRNEWSRFLHLIAAGQKKYLFPCYRDIDAYDMPKEFAHLQGQDLSKIGAVQDIVYNIQKIIPKEKVQSQAKRGDVSQGNRTGGAEGGNMIKRGNIALEDGKWKEAVEFFEKALDQNPENSQAYLGEFLAREQQPNLERFVWTMLARTKNATLAKLTIADVYEEHITEVAEKYAIPGYLNKEEIVALYKFDTNYTSEISARRKDLADAQRLIREDKLLSRAIRYANGQNKAELEKQLSSLTNSLKKRINEAEAKDAAVMKELSERYKELVRKTDVSLPERHEAAKVRLGEELKSIQAQEAQLAQQIESKKEEWRKELAIQDAVDHEKDGLVKKIARLRKKEKKGGFGKWLFLSILWTALSFGVLVVGQGLGYHMGVDAFKWLSEFAMFYVDDSPVFFFIKHFLICGTITYVVQMLNKMGLRKRIRKAEEKLAAADGSKVAHLQKELEAMQNQQIHAQRKREQLEKLL